MALGNKSGFASGALIFLSPRSKNKAGEKVAPFFSVGRVVNGKIEQTEETVTSVSGNLARLEVKERDFNGSKMKEAILYLRDNEANETYRIGLTFSIPSRGLFNSLAGLKTYEGLSIDYYTNKKNYDTFALKQNGEKTEWKYQLADVPKAEEILRKDGTVALRDYSEVDAFFEKELLLIAAAVNKSAPESTSSATKPASGATAPVTEQKPVAQENLDEDVPF